MSVSSTTVARGTGRGFLIFLICLVGVLAFLFRDGFHPDKVIFSNDGPLGFCSSKAYTLPDIMTGAWFDLNWLGISGGAAPPNLSNALMMSLGPLYYAKFLAPAAMLILGLCAWLFFRQLGFNQTTCLLAGLAAALNSNIFSHVCWGLGTRALTAATFFLALTALTTRATRSLWLKTFLAGAAVGLGVLEGADVAILFSFYVAAFVLFQSWLEEAPPIRKIGKGISRVAVIAVFSVILSIHGLFSFWGVAVKDIAAAAQDAETKKNQWNFATQWSLTKTEMLRVIIPGLYGYRMDTPQGLPERLQEKYKGAHYWGSVGQDMAVPGLFNALEDPNPEVRNQAAAALQRVLVRHSGAGEYAGVLVILIGLWSVAQSFRKTGNPFSTVERKWIWFWGGAALISILLGCGRYAPFYQLFYALPYVSTIRNPMKFMHPFHGCFIILFAYGLEGLGRRYLETVVTKTKAVGAQAKGWWASAATFDRRWILGSIAAFVLCTVGWLFYANSRRGLERHLQHIGFDPAQTPEMAKFSIHEAGLFIFFLFLSLALLTWILSGALAGRRARWAGILLGLLLVVDMARANRPWIISYNYKEKYASNPIVDILRQKPHEARVTTIAAMRVAGEAGQLQNMFQQLYGIEWLQQLFPYYNVQSLDVTQMSRRPEDNVQFEERTFALGGPDRFKLQPRHWQLTNTRYLLGLAGYLDALNELTPGQFRIHTRFEIVPKPGVSRITRLEELTANVRPDGPLALFEYTGALPRAKLFSNWEINTNNQAVLQQLTDIRFNPAQTVMLTNQIPLPPTGVATNQSGRVEITHYSPKHVELKTQTDAPNVLVLNDRFDPDWKVWVDGKEEPLLRCNFLMRGVYLQPGNHTVRFKFKPPVSTLYVSLAAIGLSVLLCGLLLIARRKSPVDPAPVAPVPKPQKASR